MKDNIMVAAHRIFTGDEWIEDHALITNGGSVIDIVPVNTLPQKPEEIYPMLAPAFIDLQIYGAYGKLFSVFPDTGSLKKLNEYCRSGGAAFFQPTAATNSYEVFFACIDAVRKYWEEGGQGCIGLHIEGPWISPAKKGAHIESFIHSPSLDNAKKLLDYGKGVITMITLAPEVCTAEIVQLVQSYGVIVSAGHSNATYAQATAAFDNGITTATHLYNAMSAFQHRAPGMAGAILDHQSVMCSIVPDGFHVDFSAVRIAKKIMQERLFVITDAVTETTEGPYPHYLAGDKYEANGILSGSALTMIKSVQNLVNKAGISLEEALRMTGAYPAKLMNQQHRLGKLCKGSAAQWVALSDGLEVIAVA